MAAARLLITLATFAVAVIGTGCSSDEGEPSPGGGSSGTADGGGAKPLGESCDEDGDCESGVCFQDRQSFCTLRCSAEDASACVAPLTGSCNKKGFCKRS